MIIPVKYCSFVHMKWNVTLYGLLFSGLGAFSYLLLANYSDLSPHVADMLFSQRCFYLLHHSLQYSWLLNVAAQFLAKQSICIEYPQTLENYYHLYSRNSSVLSF